MWLVSSLAWTLGVLPVIVLRKANLAGNVPACWVCVSFLTVFVVDGTGATSPAGTVAAAMSKSSTRRAVAVYTVSALLLLVLHTYDAPALKESGSLSMFVRSR